MRTRLCGSAQSGATARHAQTRLDDVIEAGDPFEASNMEAHASLEWAGVERLISYWQSATAHDLRARIAAREAGMNVKV